MITFEGDSLRLVWLFLMLVVWHTGMPLVWHFALLGKLLKLWGMRLFIGFFWNDEAIGASPLGSVLMSSSNIGFGLSVTF